MCRTLDQSRIDLLETRRFINRREFVRRRIPIRRLDRWNIAADDQLLIERLAKLREIAIAAQFAGKSPTSIQRTEDRSRRLLLFEHPVQRRIGEGRVELGEEGHILHIEQKRIHALGTRRRDHLGRIVDTKNNRAPLPIFLVSVPSPQPTSRMRSPGCGSSRSNAASPSSATNAPTRA